MKWFIYIYITSTYREGRPSLVQMQAQRHYDDGTRPVTILSLDDTGNSSNLQSSASNHLQGEDGLLTGRSSRSSRRSRIGSRSSDSLNNSQLSLVSGQSQSSFLQPEIIVDGEAWCDILPTNWFPYGCISHVPFFSLVLCACVYSSL